MKALEGLRLLDLTHMLSGPYATMMLADLGMETIKVEPPGRGEGTRRLLASDPKNSRFGHGAYFMTLNRNKQSVTLNLKSEEGLALFYDLVRTADVVAYNFAPGVAERLRISHGVLCEVNPRVVTCSITGFGETGPRRDQVSFDLVAQGVGGGMSITGEPGGSPTRSGIPIGDLGGGVMGVIGILSALQARERTGKGQHVDISMMDAQLSLLNYMATMHFLSEEVPGALGNGHFVHVPYGTFRASDGHLIIAVIVDSFWHALLDVVDIPELRRPELDHQPGRWAARDEINARLSDKLRTRTKAHWLERLRAARVPSAPVNDFREALEDEQTKARGMVVEVPVTDPASTGRVTHVRQPGCPIKLSDASEPSFNAPPAVGEHNRAILGGLLGRSDAELSELAARGVI